MGLCKCPKRKVTNLFCFEHRVNVCENCLVSNHEKCIVKSYLQWLQDSDYNPVCTLCNQSLSSEDPEVECIRLLCYDVFHWSCLNQYARSLPANTAPAGYTCPTCKTEIFPAANLASPVAEVVKAKLTTVNWARAGLGLPLIAEVEEPRAVETVEASNLRAEPSLSNSSQGNPSFSSPPTTRPSAQVPPYSASPPAQPPPGGHSVISVDGGTTVRLGQGLGGGDSRKLFDTTKDDIFNLSHDHDEDKYKRRPALSWLARWFKSVEGKKTKDPNLVRKRFLMVLIIGIIGFITLVIIFSKLGRDATADDPFLDPMANPNIRVNEKEIQA